MSQQNVETVRGLFGAWARRDLDEALAPMDEGGEWQMAEDEPDARTLYGHAAVRSMVEGWAEPFDEFSGAPQEFIDAGEHVVVPLVFLARPRGSDASVTIEETQVYTLRAGVVVRVREYRTKAEALQAIGMPR